MTAARRANALPALVEKNSRTDETSASTEPSCCVRAVSVRSITSLGVAIGPVAERSMPLGRPAISISIALDGTTHGSAVSVSITPVVRSSTTSSARGDELGALQRPTGPEQRLCGARRHGCDEVDLRQRLAARQRPAAPRFRR